MNCAQRFWAKVDDSAEAARSATPAGMDIDYQTADAFAYTPTAPVDFIVSSQFTHHLTDEQVVEFLRWAEANSLNGWHVADLHRNSVAFYGSQLLGAAMGWHRIIVNDCTISIARSFRRQEWQAHLGRAAFRQTSLGAWDFGSVLADPTRISGHWGRAGTCRALNTMPSSPRSVPAGRVQQVHPAAVTADTRAAPVWRRTWGTPPRWPFGNRSCHFFSGEAQIIGVGAKGRPRAGARGPASGGQ